MLHHELSGMQGIAALRRLDDSLNEAANLESFANQLQQLYAKLRSANWEALIVAEPGSTEDLAKEAAQIWQSLPQQSAEQLRLPMLRETRRECWVANSQVSFCAKAYATVPSGHADAAALTVLSGYLRNGFLHRAIREQGGAYGGGASHDASIAAFRFYSYRDPRIEGTLNDFDASIEWMANGDHNATGLEEAILGVIGTIDKPGSPAGEAKQDFHNRRFGRNHEQRMAFRQRILEVSLEDLKRVSAQYLVPEKASIAVVTGNTARKDSAAFLESLGLVVKEL
jgi:Zn-dependent M16 (insulinase) family peptidase